MTLVTGGTGFIGGHLLERLLAAGETVRALVRRKTDLPAGVQAFSGDLATGEGLDAAVRGAETVIHLAGVTKALRTAEYYTGNMRATENLARALAGRGVRFVHVSSLAAVGPSPDGKPVAEDAEPWPLTHYGKSKLEAERVVRHLTPEAVIVRPPVVYGPRDTDVFQLLRSISRGLVLEIAGGERWFSAIYVKDLCDGLIAAARTPSAAGRDYFLARATPVSWSAFGAAAARIMGRTPRVVKVPPPIAQAAGAAAELWSRITGKPGILSREKVREARATAWTCDTRRATAELGFTAGTSIEAGLAATLAWYKEAGWLTY
ncbi:MAG TPA: NAD-dependent epimerase/dehydratase family protein [Candidatus Acidoferrales bacterium]|nr:NAD-dependent epimerase/dehydratase family protein [Candidatus Acidoferrales bacterium]